MITTRVKIASQRENEDNVDFILSFHGAAPHRMSSYFMECASQRFGKFDGINLTIL
jgi:hypothetical protein